MSYGWKCILSVQRHLARNKELPRERVHQLVDPGTPVLELSALAGYSDVSWEEEQPNIPSGGIVTAIGIISQQLCMMIANDATVKVVRTFPLRSRNIYEPKRLPWRIIYRVSTWLTRVEPIYPNRHRYFRINFILDVSFTIKPI